MSVIEVAGRDNPIRKAAKGGPVEIYRARLKEDGNPSATMTIKSEDPDLLDEVFPGIMDGYMSRYEIKAEKVEFGVVDDE